MKKKLLCLLLMLAMVFSMIGCSKSDKSSDSSNANTPTPAQSTPTEAASTDTTAPEPTVTAIDFSEEPYTLKVSYAVMSEAQPDLALIQEKLNEITLKEINAKVELEAVGLFNMANTYALKASSQEKMDLIMLMPGYQYLANFANTNLIQPIDEVVATWGNDIKEILGEQLAAGQFKGKQYTIPQKVASNPSFGINLLRSTVDKYNIDITTIKTYNDLDPIFELVHQNEPDMTIIYPESTGGNIASILAGNFDTLGSAFGGLRNGGLDDTKVVNTFETEEFKNAVYKVREWYLKGYISKDVTTTQESGSRLFAGGNIFTTAVTSVNPAMEISGFNDPIDAVSAVLHRSVFATEDSQLFMWAVPASCERPDKAVQFINLLDSSKELGNLMRFGIEGKHYNLDENGSVVLAEEAANYRNYWQMFGDELKWSLRAEDLLTSPDGTEAGYRKMMADALDNTKYSKAYGFTFDPSNVKTEAAACDAVQNEYLAAIGNGTVDPETELKAFNDKLYAAGMQTIIDEKQRQLDEWLASK